jgi:glycerophosphoryl diester phosphodiesterase
MPRVTVVALVVIIAGCSDNPVGPKLEGPAIIAHRGASHFAPEHTTAAYDRAISVGADYLEQDIARTKDGILVVIHDATLDRTARGPAADCIGAVRDKTLSQLRRCDFGSWFNDAYPDRANPAFSNLGILTLEEALTRYRGAAGFYIEIKNPELYPGIEAELVALLRLSGLSFADGRHPSVFVQSFSTESLKRIRGIEPALALVQLVGSEGIATPTAFFEIQKYARGIALPGGALTDLLVALANAGCVALHPYGVESPDVMTSLLQRGVDGIITDRPDMLREIIRSEKPVTGMAKAGCGLAEVR